MATNLALDDKLIEDALTIGNHKTKKAVVTEASHEPNNQNIGPLFIINDSPV